MSREEAVEAEILDMSHDGRGVADIDGRRLFVPGALPGEKVLVKIRRRRRKYQEAELQEIITQSPERVDPGCEYFGRCGGCALQHLEYQAQVTFKQTVVAEALSRIAKLDPAEWLPPITASQMGYRRRARLGIKYVIGKERVLVGFRERAAPYITDMARCPVLAAPMDSALSELAAVVAASSLKQRIPQAEVAIGDDFGAVVLRVLDPPKDSDLALFRDFARQYDLDLYLQPGGPGTVFALSDDPRQLSYTLPNYGIRFEFTPTDFVQVNAEINAAMVEAAVTAAGLEPSDRVLDLYCGLGNFSLPIARWVAEVCAVEGDGGLVARAAKNAELNGINNSRFFTADLAQSDWSFFREQWDVVVLDPARTGAETAVASMARMAPRRIVYVSCHPGTLARDAAVLVGEQGYLLKSAQVLDMFPHTHHVETIAVFDKVA